MLDKLKGLLGGRKAEAKQAVDKVADVVDDKTGGKYAEQIESGSEKAKGVIDDVT